MKLEPGKLVFIHRKVDEVLTDTRPPGVDKDWIKTTNAEERLCALELMRRRVYGDEKLRAPIRRVIEVVFED